MKFLLSILLLVLGTSVFGLGSASAQILNGTFSANATAFTASYGYVAQSSSGAITNWGPYHGGNSFGINGTDTGNAFFGPADQSTVRDYVFLQNNGGSGTATGIGVYQTINLNPSTTYTLTYSIASRNYELPSQGTLSIYDGVVTTAAVNTNQPATGASLFLSDTQTGSQAGFTTITDTFTTPATLSAAGQTISLVNTTADTTMDHTVDYTNIVLTAMPASIPEPSSFVSLLGLGAGALFFARRRLSKA